MSAFELEDLRSLINVILGIRRRDLQVKEQISLNYQKNSDLWWSNFDCGAIFHKSILFKLTDVFELELASL